MGVGSLKILAGVLVLRAARGDRRACQRPWRLSCVPAPVASMSCVSCGSGWSVLYLCDCVDSNDPFANKKEMKRGWVRP